MFLSPQTTVVTFTPFFFTKTTSSKAHPTNGFSGKSLLIQKMLEHWVHSTIEMTWSKNDQKFWKYRYMRGSISVAIRYWPLFLRLIHLIFKWKIIHNGVPYLKLEWQLRIISFAWIISVFKSCKHKKRNYNALFHFSVR